MKDLFPIYRRVFGAFVSATTITLSLWGSPSLGADPFRATAQHNIGNNTEAAFNAIFKEGDYKVAAPHYLQQAESSEPNEPLVYAMEASLAYLNMDKKNQNWDSFNFYASKTLTTAQGLVKTDSLRGNLYIAVGQFLQGAANLLTEGTLKGTPDALTKLRQVYDSLDKAEAISPHDAELNLIRGYMDLMIAVNLPFSDPQQAIDRLKNFAGPRYLADRGLALGYRDLKQYSDAQASVDRALQSTPHNPELYYLKAQILFKNGKNQKNQSMLKDAVSNFDMALQMKAKLPDNLVRQIQSERDRAASRLASAK